MKAFLSLAVLLTLGACSAPDGYPMVYDHSIGGVASELLSPGSTYRARLQANDAKCQQDGFKLGEPGYAECRHRLDSQIQ